jgi:predicted house-cleaning noncanonical NTP pyrophosphatase (MazG superfamily)
MKSKEELLGEYREMVENNALHKDAVFLEVLIDIRDALAAVEKRMHPMQDQSKESQSPPEPAN